jgi:hypothetical protein
MTRFALNVERSRPRTPEPEQLPLAGQVMAELKERLPPEACCFTVGSEAPGIVICHRGRSLGLHIKQGPLSAQQTACFHRLRGAGMRIETARSLNEAMKLVAEMGVTLKPAIQSPYAARDLFREETRPR